MSAEEYVGGEILVRFRTTATTVERTAVERAERLGFLQEIPSIRVRLYRLPEGTEVLSAVDRCRRYAYVEFAEPNHTRQLMAAPDPYYSRQWALSNTGQAVNGISGPAGVDIRWPQAMALFTGTRHTAVAVVDSGIAIDHKDILANAWVIDRELFGVSGRDDDGNGFVDDVIGWDFYAQDAVPLDENGHGTLVASIIAGVSNNGIGVSGICPTAKVMALRVLNQFGRGGIPKFARVSDVALALDYALRNGARIVNLSLGGTSYSTTEYLMFQALSSGGVLVVAAAGNGGFDGIGDNNDNLPIYPASYNVGNIIAVAAQNRSGGLAYFSNFGVRSVHIAAPGTDIIGADVTRRTFFSEGFEGSLAGWAVGSVPGNLATQPWSTGVAGGNTFLMDRLSGFTYSPFTNTWARSPLINLAGAHGARLTFNIGYDLADDWLWVEASSDGVTWLPYDFIAGSSLYGQLIYERNIDLSDFDGGSVYFRFRLFSDNSVQGIGVAIDSVSITGVTTFDSSVPRFRYADGTSFAAPIVSGVAALVMSQRPDLSANQVRTIILNSARQVAGLSGKVASGGMVDAEAALRMANAIPSASAPSIATQPQSQTLNVGGNVTLSVVASGTAAVTYQWHKDGVAISGATGAILTLSNLQVADAGSYSVVVTNSAGSVTSNNAVLTVTQPAPTARLANLSVRTSMAAAQTLIVGVVVNGGARDILVRAAGPALAGFGLAGAMADPQLELFNGSTRVFENQDWPASLASTFASVGAFGFSAGSRDAAFLQSIDGARSIQARGPGAGVVLVEAYDTGGGAAARLVNVSARNRVGTGDDILIAGFNISGTGTKQLLIRAVGPKLGGFGVSGYLADPVLEIYSSNGSKLTENDNWSPTLAATFSSVGAFALDAGSRDAALVTTLSAGSYTVQVRGTVGGTGEALIEIYEVP